MIVAGLFTGIVSLTDVTVEGRIPGCRLSLVTAAAGSSEDPPQAASSERANTGRNVMYRMGFY